MKFYRTDTSESKMDSLKSMTKEEISLRDLVFKFYAFLSLNISVGLLYTNALEVRKSSKLLKQTQYDLFNRLCDKIGKDNLGYYPFLNLILDDYVISVEDKINQFNCNLDLDWDVADIPSTHKKVSLRDRQLENSRSIRNEQVKKLSLFTKVLGISMDKIPDPKIWFDAAHLNRSAVYVTLHTTTIGHFSLDVRNDDSEIRELDKWTFRRSVELYKTLSENGHNPFDQKFLKPWNIFLVGMRSIKIEDAQSFDFPSTEIES